ncbi:recombinase family protein [Segnochrobactrum spirostomi]|uniref:Resolvase/invertase-type recombinase catalytic domain-containing protein n=1 Tax=Segnochrobactrum spirostomi TaxID=2608987 RepID=A0A6A7XZA8_9HYPH|nr:recombinase family protein [Segnochrobactrum spirostomi]MQT12024.1 hypothetical protein [Segnochrobactrum spirostomi]
MSARKPRLIPAIALLRVSTSKQEKEGHGLDLQRTRIDEYAKHAGFKIEKVFREQASAFGSSESSRAILREAIEYSRKTGMPIIVDELSRFARNYDTLKKYIEDGTLKLISAKSGEHAPSATILGEAARAQKETEVLRMTTREALQLRRQQGRKLGNPRNLEVAQINGAAANAHAATERAQELLPVIRQLKASGKTTHAEIAEGLNSLGFRTPRNARWTKDNVRRIVERVEKLESAESEAQRIARNPDWGKWS